MCWSQVLPRRLCPLRRACRTAARTSRAPDKALGGHHRLCQCGHSLRLAARLAVPQQHPHLPRPAVWRAWIDAPPRWRGTPEERRDYYQPANPKQRAGAMPLSLAAPAASTRSGGLATHFDASTGVAELWLARPAKGNALDGALWAALPEAVARLAEDDAVRCVLVCGEGRHFCTGIDLGHLTATMAGGGNGSADEGRRREALRRGILRMQQSISCLEELRCPVVAAVHGACYGAGVDLVTACDVRVCSDEAKFCVKEADVGLAADVGTLQRLPSLVGHGVATEWCLTARAVGSGEAQARGLVAQRYGDATQMLVHTRRLCAALAAKSPLALAGTKRVLLRVRDGGSVAQNLDYVATWNSAQLLTEDIPESVAAMSERRKPKYKDLISKL